MGSDEEDLVAGGNDDNVCRTKQGQKQNSVSSSNKMTPSLPTGWIALMGHALSGIEGIQPKGEETKTK